MAQNVQYITNEAGDRVGVVLDIGTYQQLTADEHDPELLTDLSVEELVALVESTLSAASQAELDDLLARNAESQLLEAELTQLDRLLQHIDQLNILKARSRYTLHQLGRTELLAS
ncbi:hypothetical protein C7293_25815 [filamentous cyanobacterium CCT1]|nr:hypothetical protein C7293_25815 [filamentous cyanobacterium CCT1]PSN75887.1 hypothetical protein C8B47_30195 [filamentous cyanobacterium CCP4]